LEKIGGFDAGDVARVRKVGPFEVRKSEGGQYFHVYDRVNARFLFPGYIFESEAQSRCEDWNKEVIEGRGWRR
jgi:hypothetical protein